MGIVVGYESPGRIFSLEQCARRDHDGGRCVQSGRRQCDIASAKHVFAAPRREAHSAHGGKVLLSFGGATSSFDITDAGLFARHLTAYVKANRSLYDGFDFDDEVIPANGQQQLIDVLQAVRQAFPAAVISFDAFIDGADPKEGSGHQGEDIAVIAQAGSAVDYVNVMAYDQYGWKPSNHPNCSYTQGSRDDCRLDVLQQFAQSACRAIESFPRARSFSDS